MLPGRPGEMTLAGLDRPGVPGKTTFPTGRAALLGDGPTVPGKPGVRFSAVFSLPVEGVTVLGI
jgi:hypothetical protein